MADFPAAKYSGVTVTDNVTDVLATHHNTQDAEIVAIEAELGTDPAGSATDVKTRLAVMMADDGTLEFADSTVLTISSGAITVTQNYHRIATEGGAGSDLLATINGLANDGAVLFLRPSTANDIILDTGADNITCRDGADITLADTNDIAVLVYDANLTTWIAGVFAGGGVLTTSTGAADSYIAVYTAAGNIEGTDDLQWNATTFTIGDGTAARDYIITINGETNNFVATWMEDEDYLLLADSLFMSGAARIYFSEAGGNIYAPANNYIYIEADTQVALRAGQIWLGSQKAGQDIELLFYGESSSGVITWMEDEDYFQFSDDILMLNQEKIYFDSTDSFIGANTDDPEDLVIAADQDILLQADNEVVTDTVIRGASTLYRRYYHLSIGSFDGGASGATFVPPDGNTVGGWQLNANTELLYLAADVHSDWDGVSDITVEVKFDIRDASAENDTVDLKLVCYYKSSGDSATKTQTVEVATNVGDGGIKAQWTQFTVEFTINEDEVDNNIDPGDIVSMILNLETDTSEVDDITINAASFFYNTTHLGVEASDT